MGKQLGVDSRLLETNDDYNRGLSKRYVETLQQHLPKGASVTVLGLAYKPMSHVIEESPGIFLCKALSEAGYRVIGHDNLAAPFAKTALKMSALVTDSLDEALKDADVVLVTTADHAYTSLTADSLLRDKSKVTVIDFWRRLKHLAADERINYVPIGLCRNETAASAGLKPLWS